MLSRSSLRNYFATSKLQRAEMLASQTIPSWNQIIVWLREMEILRKAAA